MMTTTTTTTTTSRLRRLLLALLSGAAALWLSAPDASAHAAYESSTPGFAEVLVESPSEISIRFTQELFRREGANAISLEHVDSGETIALGTPSIGNDDRHAMSVGISQELAAGRYLVSWTNLSAEDGDEDVGSYPFYVSREATTAEEAEDRQIAGDLLVLYPDDAADADESEATSAPSAPAVVRTEDAADTELGAGPIVFLSIGVVAGLLLVGALGYRFGARNRGA